VLVNGQLLSQDRFSLEIIPRAANASTPVYYNSSNPIYLSKDGTVTDSSKAYPCNLRPSFPFELGSQLYCSDDSNALGIRSDFASQPLSSCISLFASDKPVGCFNRGFTYNKVSKLIEWPVFGSRFWLVQTKDGAGNLIGERSLWASIGNIEDGAPVEDAMPVSLRVNILYKQPTGPHRVIRF
jgi:hypothetical protein